MSLCFIIFKFKLQLNVNKNLFCYSNFGGGVGGNAPSALPLDSRLYINVITQIFIVIYTSIYNIMYCVHNSATCIHETQ